MSTQPTGRIRISWSIGSQTGHGSCFARSQTSMLEIYVKKANKQHGDRTHWIEDESIDAAMLDPPNVDFSERASDE